jgi:hypothetical protein
MLVVGSGALADPFPSYHPANTLDVVDDLWLLLPALCSSSSSLNSGTAVGTITIRVDLVMITRGGLYNYIGRPKLN